nr:hypothetical protein [Enterococcus faecalis]
MFTDIEVIKRYLHEATYVFINGDFDRLSYLDIGIALSVGKTLYVISMNPNVTKEDLGIPFPKCYYRTNQRNRNSRKLNKSK